MRFGPTISLWKNRISPKARAVISPNQSNFLIIKFSNTRGMTTRTDKIDICLRSG